MFATGTNGRGGARPGAGRKCNAIRKLCQIAVHKRIPILCEFVDDEEASKKDRIMAFRELARIGIPQQHEPIFDEEQTSDPNRIDYDAMSHEERRKCREAKLIMAQYERKQTT